MIRELKSQVSSAKELIFINLKDPLVIGFLKSNRLNKKPFISLERLWPNLTDADVELLDKAGNLCQSLDEAAVIRINTGLTVRGEQVWASGVANHGISRFISKHLYIRHKGQPENSLTARYPFLFGLDGLVYTPGHHTLNAMLDEADGNTVGKHHYNELEFIYQNMRAGDYQLISEDYHLVTDPEDAHWFRMPTGIIAKGKPVHMVVGRNTKECSSQPFHCYNTFFSTLEPPYCCMKPKDVLGHWADFGKGGFSRMIGAIRELAEEETWTFPGGEENDILSAVIRNAFYGLFVNGLLPADDSRTVFNTGLKTADGDEICVLFARKPGETRWRCEDVTLRCQPGHEAYGELLKNASAFRPSYGIPNVFWTLSEIQKEKKVFSDSACVTAPLMYYPLPYLQKVMSFYLDPEDQEKALEILNTEPVEQTGWNELRKLLASPAGERARHRISSDLLNAITASLKRQLADQDTIKPFYAVATNHVNYLLPVTIGGQSLVLMADKDRAGRLFFRAVLAHDKAYIGFRTLSRVPSQWLTPTTDDSAA